MELIAKYDWICIVWAFDGLDFSFLYADGISMRMRGQHFCRNAIYNQQSALLILKSLSTSLLLAFMISVDDLDESDFLRFWDATWKEVVWRVCPGSTMVGLHYVSLPILMQNGFEYAKICDYKS